MNPKADFYFNKEPRWQEEINKMRTIVLDCGLDEELKWGCPCYTYEKTNIVLIHVFKEYCALLFFKGSLLQDPEGVLIRQTKNVQVPRQMRFTSAREIVRLKTVIKAYIFEAIEVEKSGLKPKLKKTSQYVIPEEFQKKLDKSPGLKSAFHALTPGRQRGYLLYFSAPKLSATRASRVEKSVKQILEGKGLTEHKA